MSTNQQPIARGPNISTFDVNERGLWFYTKDFTFANSHIDAMLRKQINTMYMSTGADGSAQGLWSDPTKRASYISFINYAKSKGMKVFSSVLEDPSFVEATEATLRTWFGNFVKDTKPYYDTYIVDVEPHVINLVYPGEYLDFTTNKAYYYNKYISMSAILRTIADEEGVRYVDTVPPWYHDEMISFGITGGLNNLSSHGIVLMAYSSTVSAILTNTASVRSQVAPNIRTLIAFNIITDITDPFIPKTNIRSTLTSLQVTNGLPTAIFRADTEDFFNQPDGCFKI